LTLASMTEAALTAAAIANDKTAKARVQAISPMNLKNLYPVKELASEAELTRKLSFIKESNDAAKAFSTKIAKVQCFFSDQVKYLAYVNSDGVSWTDAQPNFGYNVSCIAEEGTNRQTGYDGASARMGLEYFA